MFILRFTVFINFGERDILDDAGEPPTTSPDGPNIAMILIECGDPLPAILIADNTALGDGSIVGRTKWIVIHSKSSIPQIYKKSISLGA